MMLDDDDWAEMVANSAAQWFADNHMDIGAHAQDQGQVNCVNEALTKYRMTPEQQQLVGDHDVLIKHAVYEGLFKWSEASFLELCPDCEKTGVVITMDGKTPMWMCRKECGWYGQKTEVLRRPKNHRRDMR